MKFAESAGAQHDEDTVARELGAWRAEVRRHALTRLGRKPARPPWVLRIGALVLLLLVHAGLLVGLRDAMRAKVAPDETAIQVSWVDLSLPEPPLPLPSPLPSAAPAPHPSPAISGSQRILVSPLPASAASQEPAAAGPALRIYNADGSVIVPPDAANQGGNAALQASFLPQSTAVSPVMRHQRPLKVRPNHFAQNWQAASNETILGTFVRERLTAETEFITPWGTHMKCGLIVFMGACSWGPAPAWKPSRTWQPATELDEE
ncbi:MAG: hypothetical protein P4L92_16765 [Rudaea sp.]|nr:hypothetical protein [Rudaea sp.]